MIAGECSLLAHREILLQRNLGRYRGQADTQQAAFHSIWLERPTRSAFPWFESCRRQLPRGACNTLETSASGARRPGREWTQRRSRL